MLVSRLAIKRRATSDLVTLHRVEGKSFSILREIKRKRDHAWGRTGVTILYSSSLRVDRARFVISDVSRMKKKRNLVVNAANRVTHRGCKCDSRVYATTVFNQTFPRCECDI